MTNPEAEAILAMLKAAYPHADNGLDPVKAKDRTALYRGVIRSWKNAAAGAAAAEAHVRSSKWWPTVADLQDAYNAAARTPHPERQPVAGLLADGNSPATPEQVKAACAEAVRRVTENQVQLQPKPARGSRSVAQAERELEGAKGIATPPELDRKTAATGKA